MWGISSLGEDMLAAQKGLTTTDPTIHFNSEHETTWIGSILLFKQLVASTIHITKEKKQIQ